MPDLIAQTMSRYANFAMSADGLPEVNSLTYVGFESDFAEPLPNQRLALALVEPRLLVPGGDPKAQPALTQCLRRLKGDLRAEGLLTRFIAADLYRGRAEGALGHAAEPRRLRPQSMIVAFNPP